MAVLQQIRVKFGLVISIIIALALLSFIIDVNTLESALNMMSSKYDVGEIAGKSISYTDFQGDVERLTNINEIVTGSSASNEEIQNQIRNAAWQELVYKYLFIKNAKAAGVNVGEDEMVALTTGDIISPVIAQDPVFAGEDGTFSKDVLINLVQNINQDASGQIKTYWNYVQNTVLINQYYTKYADLFMKSNFQTPLMTRNAVAENNNTTDVDFVLVPLNPYVTDSTVVVSSDEIKKFYNDHKKMFKQNASRDIEYVVFEVKPSDDDIKATNEAFTKSYDEFLTVEAADMKKFISKNSSRPYTGYWYKDGELSTINTDLSEFVAANTTGVSPIITNGTTFYAAKILATAMMPDEVFVKHILLTGTDAKTKAEEILREVNADNFSSLAAEYSEDQNSAADGELGSLGWMSQTNMINGFESVLEAQVGKPFIIETIYGTSVVLVTEKSEPVLKKQVAVLEKESIPSKQTYNEWYSKANNFATLAHGSYDNYKKAVESEGVYSHPDVNVLESRTTYGSIDGAKELTRWVFETKPGKVSDIITVNTNYFFVATVTGVHKEGYADETS